MLLMLHGSYLFSARLGMGGLLAAVDLGTPDDLSLPSAQDMTSCL